MSKVIITFEVPITHSFISTEKITHSGSDLSNILAWAVTYGKSFIANILQISKAGMDQFTKYSVCTHNNLH